MLLSADKVKEAILHPDQDVREAAVRYFANSFSPDRDVMPLVIQAIERFAVSNAFETYIFMDELAQTEETVRWLIQQIETTTQGDDEAESQREDLIFALIHADPSLLKSHQDEIMSLPALGHETRQIMHDRMLFLARPPGDLWHDLEELCGRNAEEDDLPDEDYAFGCRLVEALGRYRDQHADKAMAILQGNSEVDFWMEGFAARLAGEMKLEAAISHLIAKLDEPGGWIETECEWALSKIGTDAVALEFAKCAPEDWNRIVPAANVLENIHSQRSVQTGLDLFSAQKEPWIQGLLISAVLRSFATEGVEPARQFILNTPLNPDVLEVRTDLLTACKVLGERFPELDTWLEESKNDREFRQEWYAEQTPASDAGEDWYGDDAQGKQDFNENSDEEYGAEPSLPPTYVRQEARVGRNDPCPCGSGKKFKKCCMNKGNAGKAPIQWW